VDNPSVGRNLSDHVLLTNAYQVNSTGTFDDIFRVPSVLDAMIAQWEATKTGPVAGPFANQIGWLRLPANASIFETVEDPSAGPNSSHWEILFAVSLLLSFLSLGLFRGLRGVVCDCLTDWMVLCRIYS
jgi:hypothetical protein